MTLTIHPTKIYSPQDLQPEAVKTSPPGWVSREALYDRLNALSAGGIIFLSSPNGSGKTTLIQSWLASLGQELPDSPQPVATWLRLDPGDNDPVRFLAGIITSLNQVYPALGASVLASLETPHPPDVTIELTSLLAEITRLSETIILVLDDYETITASRIHQVMISLAVNCPQNLLLVLACGADLPKDLETARQRENWPVIGFQDLKLTAAEIEGFFEIYAQSGLSKIQLDIMLEHTQGLALAVQLAALAARRNPDPDHFWSSIEQHPATNLTYLVEQVLMRQMEPVREFLFCTSILSRLSGPLCDMVMRSSPSGMQASDRGRVTLEHCHKNHLFTTVLDPEHTWYRFHPEFARILSEELQHRYPFLLPQLHQRASLWFEANQDPESAIEHALMAEDEDRVSTLIELNILDLVATGQLSTALTWLGKISASRVLLRPWLSLAEAWAVAHEGWDQGARTGFRGTGSNARRKSA